MELKYGFISADDHVQEHPEVWTSRMSKSKWGERIPHIEEQRDGSEFWIVDGQRLSLPGVAVAGALMTDRAREPQRWSEVPPMAFSPSERLEAMDCKWHRLLGALPDCRRPGRGDFRQTRRC